MVAFAPANIPNTVTTVEELMAWSASVLAQVSPTESIQTTAGAVERVVQVQTFEFRSEENNPERLVIVGYLPLTPAWRSAGKIWAEGIGIVSNAALPSTFTS
jgi:hypothetical protein